MKLKILVAEDSRTQAFGLRAELQSYDFEVVIAYNGRQALTAAGRERPDVILSDVLMPDMDGFRLCHELQLDPELRQIPVVLRTSAFLNEEDRNFALAAGAYDYITKDIGGKDLVRVLEDAVKNHSFAAPAGDLQDETFHGTYERRLLSQLVEKAAHAERVGEDLQQTQQLLEAVMGNSPAILSVKDLDARYLMVNAKFRQVFKVSSEEIHGRTSAFFLDAEDREKSKTNFKIVVETGKVKEFEEQTHQEDGVHTWLSTLFPLRNPDGDIYAVAGFSLDITERKLLEEQLMRSQKMEGLGRLAGGIAHDFNNLLSVIINYAMFAAEGLEESDRRAADLKEVVKAADRGAHLVRQLLTYSKGGTATVELVDVNGALSEIETLMLGSLPPNIELVTDLDPRAGSVEINLDQLGQVLLNLVVNARDAMPDGGTIEVTTTTVEIERPFHSSDCDLPPGSYVRIGVRDTGRGMSLETMQKIFDPFFTTKGEGGTGLGLSTVHGIVSAAGGCLTVDSEPGHGSTFGVHLPQKDTPVVTEKPDEPEIHNESREGAILIVDDEEGIRSTLHRTLTDHGYEVLVARSGQEALELYGHAGQKLAVVVTDLRMPGMGGVELADRLTDASPGLPIIFMSGSVGAKEGNELAGEGRSFLPKPFTIIELLTKVQRAIGDPHEQAGAQGV